MKIRFTGLLLAGMFAMPAWSQDTTPSDASVHQLIEVMQAKKLSENMAAQMSELVRRSAKEGMGGKLDAGEEEIVNRWVSKLMALITQQIDWSQMEPFLLDAYKKTFTQKEVNDFIAFYSTPSGQAVIEKMPQVMQQSMAFGESKVRAITPQIQKISADMAAELRAYRDGHPATAK